MSTSGPFRWAALPAVALLVACGGGDDDVVYVADDVPTPTTTPPDGVVIAHVSSPANATIEVVGLGAIGSEPITVDGEVATIDLFDVQDDGSFVATLLLDDEGTHTVCVAEACERVFVRAAGAETPEEVEATIDEALVRASEAFDGEAEFPDWRIETAGPMSGVGGSTDVDNKVITIHANRDRELDEYVSAILHEWAHVVDHERLTDDDRVEYRRLRGIPADAVWASSDVHSMEVWSSEPSEDFAEVMVAVWTGGVYTPRAGGALDAATRVAVGDLVGVGSD